MKTLLTTLFTLFLVNNAYACAVLGAGVKVKDTVLFLLYRLMAQENH